MWHFAMTTLSRLCGRLSRKFRRNKSPSVVHLGPTVVTQRYAERRNLSRKLYAAQAWLSANQAATTTSGNNVVPIGLPSWHDQ